MMKHPKKYLAVLMAISILLCNIIAITSSAADSSQGDSGAEIEELLPVVACGCPTDYIIYKLDKNFVKTTTITLSEAIIWVGGGESVWVSGASSNAEYVASCINEYRPPEVHVSHNGQNQYWHYSIEGGGHVCYGDPQQ